VSRSAGARYDHRANPGDLRSLFFLFRCQEGQGAPRAWLASGEFDKETGKLQRLADNKGGFHELSFEGIITEGGVPYKEVSPRRAFGNPSSCMPSETASTSSKSCSPTSGPQETLSDFPFKETLREPLRTGKPLFSAAIREAGGNPNKSVAMLMFVKAKQIADTEVNRACQNIMAQVEAEYQQGTARAMLTGSSMNSRPRRTARPASVRECQQHLR